MTVFNLSYPLTEAPQISYSISPLWFKVIWTHYKNLWAHVYESWHSFPFVFQCPVMLHKQLFGKTLSQPELHMSQRSHVLVVSYRPWLIAIMWWSELADKEQIGKKKACTHHKWYKYAKSQVGRFLFPSSSWMNVMPQGEDQHFSHAARNHYIITPKGSRENLQSTA